MNLEFKHVSSAKWNKGNLVFDIELNLLHSTWICSSEFSEDPYVQLTIGYLDCHKDGTILEQLFIENEKQVMKNYFEVENENQNLWLFIIHYFQNEYALLLSEKFRKERGIILPENISFNIKR